MKSHVYGRHDLGVRSTVAHTAGRPGNCDRVRTLQWLWLAKAITIIEGEIEMRKKTNLLTLTALMLLSLALTTAPASAQNLIDSQGATTSLKTNSRILYHDGAVLKGIRDVYFILYGCWTDTCGTMGDSKSILILTDLMSTIGNTPYMFINSTYTDSTGSPASGSLVFGGMGFDNSYSHGFELTKSDIEGIISDQITSFRLPDDPQGIYVVLASADVGSTATGFCTAGATPFHSSNYIYGSLLSYVFLGNPNRCPGVVGAQFVGHPTPNGSFAGDVMALNLVHALNGLLTNPYGNGWYDRYGLENADKCAGTFGQIYTTANGAFANYRFGTRDFLIEQNWINGRKGVCALYQQ